MVDTGYLPSEELQKRAATTEQRESRWMRGEVHDPRAYAMGGVAGHAGLFSTADDIAIYAQMMLGGGKFRGKRILSKPTVELMTFPRTRSKKKNKESVRGLGWDKLFRLQFQSRLKTCRRKRFGHGGFTGTVLWIDPEHDLFFIFLSNRVHPNGKGSVNRLAGRIATTIVSAIDAKPKQEQKAISSPVNVGIDVLRDEGYKSLNGQRVGLITNQTGISQEGKTTIELFAKAPEVNLRALFSPEHGLAGKLDQSIIGDTKDSKTGLQVFSLYGKSRQPSKEQLANIDTLVFDIQDIGCRFYTYISTMGLAMQAASTNGKRFVVLDRPNPISGLAAGGPGLDSGLESFVAFHSMPVRHGMTVGELAMMFKSELELDQLDLEVVLCSGWKRDQFFDETGLRWVNPSPNMRNLNQAILYPGIGLWKQATCLLGEEPTRLLKSWGAPWIECQDFARRSTTWDLRAYDLHRENSLLTQVSSKTKLAVECRFLSRIGQDFRPIRCGLALAHTLHQLYPSKWRRKVHASAV